MAPRTVGGWLRLAVTPGFGLSSLSGRIPVHIGNRNAFRSDVLLGVTMTLETPSHRKRTLHLDDGHGVDSSMAGRTADTGREVRLVTEIGVVRQLMHAYPRNRLTSREALANFGQSRTVLFHLDVTVHARLSWRDSSSISGLHRIMAIPTI